MNLNQSAVGWVVMAGSGLMDDKIIHALNDQEAKIGATTIKNGVTGPATTPIATPRITGISA